MKPTTTPRLILGALAISCTVGAAAEPAPDLPPGFEQLIPRGTIVSIDDPEFVSVQDAEIPDDAWVLGVAFGSEARAYSLNLLNRHEIVNDRIGDRSFAAVW